MSVRDFEGGYIILSGKQLLAALVGAIVFVLIVAGARGARDPKEVKLLDHGYDLKTHYVLSPGGELRHVRISNKWSAPICNTSPRDYYVHYRNLRPEFRYGVLFPNGTVRALVFDKSKATWKWENAPGDKAMVTPNNCERIFIYKTGRDVNHHRIRISLAKR